MKTENLTLRCYAERERDGEWFAMCVDLNLYARGDSFEEARGKLHAHIETYVVDAFSRDRRYFHELMRRKAPLYFRMRYRYALIRNKLRALREKHRNGGDGARPFFENLPLEPKVA